MESGLLQMEALLRQVSRSFYLTLRILPRSVRPQLSCAYLLARASDTVADTDMVDAGRRHAALLQLRESIHEACAGRDPAPPEFRELAEARSVIAGRGTPAERELIANLALALRALRNYPQEDRREIQKVLDAITHGQELDLIRFGEASAERIAAFLSDSDLEEYIYCVAGCVGEFWTGMCRAHVFPSAPLDEKALLDKAVRFGKGLQLVNILRDLPLDLRQGRCYIPADRLADHGLKAPDLLDAANMRRFRPLYESYLRRAEDYLSEGWDYTLMLPYACARVRLACAWPILIGIKTLERLRASNVLDGSRRVKLGRSEIRKLILQSVILYPVVPVWRRLPDGARRWTRGPGKCCLITRKLKRSIE